MPETLSILMIDDNPADAEIVRRCLEDEGIDWDVTFEQSLSAEEALSILRDHRVDVLIVDYRFPFGNGFDILRKIRGKGIDAPAIMLTGKGSEDIAGQAVAENLSAYLPKSNLDTKSLKGALEAAVEDDPSASFRKASGPSSTPYSAKVPFRRPSSLLSDLSSRLQEQDKSGLLLLRIQASSGDNPSAALFHETAERLRDALPDPSETDRFYRVNQSVLGGLLGADSLKALHPPSSAHSPLRQVLATETDGTNEDPPDVKISVLLEELPPSDCDPAALINRRLDRLAYPSSDDVFTVRLAVAGGVHGV